MPELKIIVRTADQTRKAEVNLVDTTNGSDVIQAAIDNWKLPHDTDYSLANASSGKAMNPGQTLAANAVKDGDILEIQPVLVAGATL